MPTGLRIFVIGNKGPASKILLSLLEDDERVVGVCSRNEKKVSFSLKIKKWLLFAAQLSGLYKPESFEFENPFAQFTSPQSIAKRRKIPFFDAKNLRSPEFELVLRQLNPDVIFVAGFHRLIPENIINVPRKAIINFHPALLPKHRGGTPNRWVIRHGEKETGVTAHFVTKDFDRGDIILQEKVTVLPGDTWGDVELRCIEIMPLMADKILTMVKNGIVKGYAQSQNSASYEPSFKGHYAVIDWSLPAQEIKQICYASRPKSGGITSINEKKFCIWDLEVVSSILFPPFPPGTVQIDRSGFPIIACGDGGVRILYLLVNGRIVPGKKVARDFKITPGDTFGI